MAKAKQPVSINGLEFDALITEEQTFEASIPQYSVEDGFSVSDSIILNPELLAMTLFVSNTPVTWYREHGGNPNRVAEVVDRLREIYFAKQPVTIVTSDAVFDNMAIESMTITKSIDTGYDREIPISFRKINVTKVATTSIPDSYGKSGLTGAPGGTANTSSKSSNSSSSEKQEESKLNSNKASILYKAAEGMQLFD